MKTVIIVALVAFLPLTHADTQIHNRFKRYIRNDLIRAFANGNSTEAKRLIESGVDANVRDTSDRTPMHLAAEDDMVEIMQLLIDRGYQSQVNKRDRDGFTPLHVAAQHGQMNATRLLLRSGSNINAGENSTWTPLHLAARSGHLNVTKLLVHSGSNLHATFLFFGSPPLLSAVFHGHAKVANFLIHSGSNLNEDEPLVWAAINGHQDVAEVLICNGVDIYAKSSSKRTILQEAIDSHKTKFADWFETVLDDFPKFKAETCGKYLNKQ